MIIDLANLGTTARQVALEFDPTEIDFAGEPIELRGETAFRGELEKIGDKAHLRGVIDADILVDCTRCLEPIDRHFEVPFRAIFVDPSLSDHSAEAELGDDELDESLVADGQIDMAEVIREQLLLAVPIQNFCREDCRGLCPKCGGNLNLIDCNCADNDIDPRWAALKSLR